MDTLNKVYLFQFDQNTQKAKMLEIDEAGKNQIRSIRENHNIETMTMNLTLILQYYLYIDDDELEYKK